MADYLVTDTELTSIANAIRTKGGTSASLTFPTGFVSAINDIQTGGGGVDLPVNTYGAGDEGKVVSSGELVTQTSQTITENGTYDTTLVSSVTVSIGDIWMEQTITTSGAVTQALDPYILYHFTGALTSLTITLNSTSSGGIAQYHFDFLSGQTAPTLTLPNTVTMPDNFEVQASKRYEIDILNNYGTVAEWTD